VLPERVLILYYLLEFGRLTAGRLPAFISYPIASLVGDTVFYAWSRGRRNMIKSIAAVLYKEGTSPEVKRTARQAMQSFCKSIVDMLRYAYPRKGMLERDVDIIGKENLDKALDEGKGVIIVSLHIGSLELGMRVLSMAGYPVNAIVNNLESGQTDKFIQKPRARSGIKLVSAGNGILHMLDILKRNEVIALMIDSPGNGKGMLVRLGNKLAIAPTGVAAMALRTGAKILPCSLTRSTNTRFYGIIGKPIQFSAAGDLAQDARELTQRVMQAMEEMARVFADQWYIFHPLIKDDIIDPGQLPEKASRADAVQ
jgi:Kdo2-lipid IVA lauroyltransferase/acyltransferase